MRLSHIYRKKSIRFIPLTILTAITSLAILMFFAPTLPNEQDNGFNRKWFENPLKQISQENNTSILTGIIGATKHNAFYSTSNPNIIIRKNLIQGKTDRVFVPIKRFEELYTSRQYIVDSPWIFLFVNNLPGIVYGKIIDTLVHDIGLTRAPELFLKSTAISSGSIVVRAFDSLQTRQVFQKINCASGEIVKENAVIKNQQEKGFADDGILAYDHTSHKLSYVQFYKNRFFVMDTNLIVQGTFQTIDTTNSNEIKLTQARISGEQTLTPQHARSTINRHASADNGKLYIISGLRADNETLSTFNKNSVMDVYNTLNGQYIGSTYIPAVNGEKISGILIKNDRCFALYKEHSVIYEIEFH